LKFNLFTKIIIYMDIFRDIQIHNANRIEQRLVAGADINQIDENGNTLLMMAILHNKLDIVRVLIEQGIDINRTVNSRNALTCILQKSDNEIDNRIIEELIEAGANVNYVDPNDGISILMKACQLNRIKLINVLLDNEVNINYAIRGFNALSFAEDNQEITNLLVTHGAVALPPIPQIPVEPVAWVRPAGARVPEVLPEDAENNLFAIRMQCGVCMLNAKNTRLNPCGHLLCSDCFLKLSEPKRCPTCRTAPVTEEPIFYGGAAALNLANIPIIHNPITHENRAALIAAAGGQAAIDAAKVAYEQAVEAERQARLRYDIFSMPPPPPPRVPIPEFTIDSITSNDNPDAVNLITDIDNIRTSRQNAFDRIKTGVNSNVIWNDVLTGIKVGFVIKGEYLKYDLQHGEVNGSNHRLLDYFNFNNESIVDDELYFVVKREPTVIGRIPNKYYITGTNTEILNIYHITPEAAPIPAELVPVAFDLGDQNERAVDFARRFECGVCNVNAVNTRLNLCGHLLCYTCFLRLPEPKRCPLCRVSPVVAERIIYGGYYNKYQKYINKLK